MMGKQRSKQAMTCKRNAMAGIVVALLLTPTVASAQGRTYYGADGSAVGRSITDSGGATTYYDAAGRVTARAATDTQGTTTIYDAGGHSLGSVTGPKRRSGDQR
jgi:hypothetical protein